MNSGQDRSGDGIKRGRKLSDDGMNGISTERVALIRQSIKQLKDTVTEAEAEICLLQYHLAMLSCRPPRTRISEYPYCGSKGYMRMLGQDLTGNNSITSMTLELWLGQEENMDTIQPLLHYIENSNSLEDVTLKFTGYSWEEKKEVTDVSVQLSDVFMNAAARNSNVKHIECRNIHPSAGMLCSFAPRCTRCSVVVDFLELYPNEMDQNRIASHLVMMMQQNATRLRLHARDDSYFCFEWNRSSEYVLHCPEPSDLVSVLISNLLGMSKLTDMVVVDIEGTRWDNLWQCLSRMSRLVELCVRNCELSQVAGAGLRNYLTRSPTMTKLRIEQPRNSMASSGQSMWELLAAFLRSLHHTSCIEELVLFASESFGTVMGCLASPGQCKIKKLNLWTRWNEDIAVLVELIPQWKSINQLVVSHRFDREEFHPILQAVLENEYMTHVEFINTQYKPWHMDETTIQRIHLHCSRNQIHSACIAVAGSMSKVQLPTMLKVLKQLKQSGISTTLKTLLICGNDIGSILYATLNMTHEIQRC